MCIIDRNLSLHETVPILDKCRMEGQSEFEMQAFIHMTGGHFA